MRHAELTRCGGTSHTLLRFLGSCRFPHSARRGERSKLAPADFRCDLPAHRNQCRRPRRSEGVSPHRAVVCHINGFERDLQLISFFKELAGHDIRDSHLAARLLQVEVGREVYLLVVAKGRMERSAHSSEWSRFRPLAQDAGNRTPYRNSVLKVDSTAIVVGLAANLQPAPRDA